VNLAGKHVVVTGGSRGVGAAIAAAFLDAGARVLITGRDPARLEAAVERLAKGLDTLSTFPGDATEPGAVQALAREAQARFGRVDVLVNNVGLYEQGGQLLELDLGIWNRALATNLTGPFLMTQAFGRLMVESGGGAIVNVSSTVAHGADGPWAAYSAAKAGLLMLTKTTASELGPHGVRCNSISPGYIDSEQLRLDVSGALYEYLRTRFARVPLRRMVTLEEVAAACVFLGSDAASGITGIDVRIDSGALADSYIAATFPPDEPA
jgi:NAD(P)-dependent dehydrogenase (short-subunit alcohol dehydrogenase family)